MVSPLWLDTAALGTLEDDLALLEPHPLDVLLGGVPTRHRARVRQHSPHVGADSQKRQGLQTIQCTAG